jgi:hypothetical protein
VGEPTGGTLLTVKECHKTRKPHLIIYLADEDGESAAVRAARKWIAASLHSGILNVAGPRASKHPAVYGRARAFLRALLGGEA